MKVAVVTSFPEDPASPRGGVESVSVNLTRALAARPEMDVHVVTTQPRNGNLYKEQWAGATIHRLGLSPKPLLLRAVGEGRRKVQRYLEQLKPDVVHAHDFYGIMTKGFQAPRVFTIHGFIHEDTRYAGSRFAWLRSRLWKRVEVGAWKDQPHIVSISPYVRERLRGLVKGVIHDIENPIAPEYFEVKRDEQPGTIFCAAAICERKNTLGLIKALKALWDMGVDAKLRWAGCASDEDYHREVHCLARTLGVSEHVSFLNSLRAEQVRQELTRAGVFALISFEEGAPMGIAEAMAAGVPVVTSNRCGMPFMVEHGESGFLVDPTSMHDIAGRLKMLLTNRLLNEQYGRKSKAFALQHFHPNRVAEKTVEVYQRSIDDFGSKGLHEQNTPKEYAGKISLANSLF